MCLGTPDIPDPVAPPPPTAPTALPKIKDPLDSLTKDPLTGAVAKRKGLASLRIDKSAAGNGLNIPQ